MSSDDKHGYFDPTHGFSQSQCPYKSGSLAHHCFASLKNNPDEQVESFCKFVLGQQRLRMGVSEIKLSFDFDGRNDSMPEFELQKYLSHVPMLCFTDAPPSFAGYHGNVYGKLGIVFSSSSLIKLKPHPVKYVWLRSRVVNPESGFINNYYNELYDTQYNIALSLIYNGQVETGNKLLFSLCCELAYCQQMIEPLRNDRRGIPQNYYYAAENEWRIIDLFQYREFVFSKVENRDKMEKEYLEKNPEKGFTGSNPYIQLMPFQLKQIFVPTDKHVFTVKKKLKDIGWADFQDIVITFEEYISKK